MLQEDAQSFLQKHSQLELLFLSQLFVPNVVWAGDRDRPVPDLSLDLETFLTLIVQNPGFPRLLNISILTPCHCQFWHVRGSAESKAYTAF